MRPKIYLCLQTRSQSGFSPTEQAAETTCSEEPEEIQGIKPIKINTVHKVTNAKYKHKVCVTTERDTNKVKRQRKHLKVSEASKKLIVLSTNGAGIVNGKMDSLRKEVKAVVATVVTVQETHSRRKGRIQMDDMVVF